MRRWGWWLVAVVAMLAAIGCRPTIPSDAGSRLDASITAVSALGAEDGVDYFQVVPRRLPAGASFVSASRWQPVAGMGGDGRTVPQPSDGALVLAVATDDGAQSFVVSARHAGSLPSCDDIARVADPGDHDCVRVDRAAPIPYLVYVSSAATDAPDGAASTRIAEFWRTAEMVTSEERPSWLVPIAPEG